MEALRALEFLQLNQLSSSWVETVWDYDFTEAEPLDSAIEEEIRAGGHKAFRRLYDTLLPYAAEQEETSEGNNDQIQSIWTLFGENGVSTKSLLAVLSCVVLEGKAKNASLQQRLRALHAASIYILLLGITGSVANRVFHQILFDTCTNVAFHCWPQNTGKKRKKDTVKSSQTEGKRSKPPRKDSDERQMEVDDMDDEDDEEEEEQVHFSGQDLMKLRDGVVLLIKSVLQLLQKFSLKDRPQNADNLAQLLTKLIDFEPVNSNFKFASGMSINDLKTVPELAFHGLWLLCLPNQGDEALQRVFHCMLYVILMMRKGNQGKPTLLVPSQGILATRDQAVHFICHVVDELKEPALDLLRTLLQHICFKMVEKSDYRLHGAQAVCMMLSKMPNARYASFIKWLSDYSENTKMVFRMFALDVAKGLLELPERTPDESITPELAPFLPHNFLVQNMLFERWMDVSPNVRGHALDCVAQYLDLSCIPESSSVQNLFTSGIRKTSSIDGPEGTCVTECTSKTYRSMVFNAVELSGRRTNFSTDSNEAYSELEERLAVLRRRIADPKVNVRKHALQALMGFMKRNLAPLNPENLAVLSDRCRDPALSVKKKALQCLGDLLNAKPESSMVQNAWLRGVVPAVVDSESSVQEKALECLDAMILSQVKNYSARGHMDASQRLTWNLLARLCQECQDLSRYFNRAFTVWSKQNKFTTSFVNNLISHTEAEHANGAWLLLSKVAACSNKVNYSKILDAWDVMINADTVNVMTTCHILSVMGDIVKHINDDTKSRILDDLMRWLKGFHLPLEVISSCVETLFQLGESEDVKQTQAFMNEHCGELVSMCDNYLSSIVLRENGEQNLNEELMIKHLHTLGVASLHCPARVGKRTVLLVQSLLTRGVGTQEDNSQGSEDLPPSMPLSQFRANSMPSSVRAHAVITLGKLCLHHEDVTLKFLPAFARELDQGKDVAVRNNVVVIMCDLCVRYTNMVDRYIPNISACLRDDSPIIREQTLIMLTNLLQEEFIKWKDLLFFRFLVVLVDPDPAIASLCEYCLAHLLLKKNPAMFFHNFIDCIFHFNSYDKRGNKNKTSQTDREKPQFSIDGPKNREKRFQIYLFMLKHFTDADRFNITRRLTKDVLGRFASAELPLDSDGSNLLSETFKILSLPEIKLKAMSTPAGGAGGEEQEEEHEVMIAKVVIQEAHKKVVSQVQKKVFIETTIPIITTLKNMLQRKCSPLVKDLMTYLQVTMQDYRSELKEIFGNDDQMVAELEYDMKMYEKQQAEINARQESNATTPMNSVPASPASAGPDGIRRLSLLQRSVQNSPSPSVRDRQGEFQFAVPEPRQPGRASLGESVRKSLPLAVINNSHPRRSGEGRITSGSNDISLHQDRTNSDHGPLQNRAISTPANLGQEISFDDSLSVIYSSKKTDESESDEGSVLSFSSINVAPKVAKKWNVESPLRQKKRQTKRL